MNRVPKDRQAQILRCLVEGVSLRSTSRITQTDVNTVQWLMEDLGRAALDFHNKHVRNLRCHRIECDELFSWVHTKDRNLKPSVKFGQNRGGFYTWVAIDPVTKLIPSWHIGRREAADAEIFIRDLWSRVTGRIQISSDAFKAYQPAIEKTFGTEVDYAHLIKILDDALGKISARDYFNNPSQPNMKASRRIPRIGNPNLDLISTSMIERLNLTIRMSLRRYSKSTDAFSKKLENHMLATALFQVWYNFARVHMTLRCTPAMEAGLADHIFEPEELLDLLK